MKGIAAAATPNIVTTATDVAADTSVSMANVAEEARGSTPSPLPKKAKAREYQTGDTRRCQPSSESPIMGLRHDRVAWGAGGARRFLGRYRVRAARPAGVGNVDPAESTA